MSEPFLETKLEMDRQYETWGEQNHDDPWWFVILGEEVGEVARDVYETGKLSDKSFRDERLLNLRAELIQVAAVALSWVEAIDRRAGS